MTEHYTENPENIQKITPYIIAEPCEMITQIFTDGICVCYDTCSFRRHANLDTDEALCIAKYIKAKNGCVVLFRCILMELASHSGVLNQEYIEYIRFLYENDIPVLVMYEESLYDVLNVVFSTNERINQHLCWAVRNTAGSVGPIAEILDQNEQLKNIVKKGQKLNQRNIYTLFFSTVRKNKKSGDDLGEGILAVCMYLLSVLPGEDGKFCVLTDDKNAAGKLYDINQKTVQKAGTKKTVIVSTPKLAQMMYREKIVTEKASLIKILSSGTSGNVVILGATIYDLKAQIISCTCGELAEQIITPNQISIIF
ncbi:MAG: hypothetical protein IKU17_08710 [Clostridia bacterium]|nr:hypothetical protein [Clostridia bacterium]